RVLGTIASGLTTRASSMTRSASIGPPSIRDAGRVYAIDRGSGSVDGERPALSRPGTTRCRHAILRGMREAIKCARCSEPIEDRQLVYFDHGDLIHVRCWHVKNSEQSIRRSKALIRESRKLMDDFHRRGQQEQRDDPVPS